MIRKNPYGLSPNIELSINAAQVDYQALNRLEVELTENQHDVLFVHLAGIPTQAITDYQNTGVLLHFDTGTSYSFDFTGYITDVRPESQTSMGLVNDSPFQNSILVCLGASYAMRGPKSRVWQNASLADVAKEFAQVYRFSLDIPKDTTVYAPMVQAQESDWQFLVRYCKMLGYSVNVHGTHIHIYDPYRAADRATSVHRLVTMRQSKGDTTPAPGQISEFKGSFSEHHQDGQYKNTVVTVRQGNTEFDVTSQEIRGGTGAPRYENRINEYVDSYAQAVRTIDAASKHWYDYEASVVVSGVAGCVPGGVVYLDNYNSGFDGLWYVTEAKHSISSGAFISTLQLARNKDSQLVTFQNTQSFLPPPRSRLMGSSWEAVKGAVREYA